MSNHISDRKSQSFSALARSAFLATLLPFASYGAALADERVLLSYEATPSVGFELPGLAKASYDDRAAFSIDVLKEIVPRIVTANGIDPASLETEVTPGGYLLKTNASLQTQGTLDDATADRLAASVGYIFHQHSVLVSRLDDKGGKTGFVVVRFPKESLDATGAQKYFEKAEATRTGLGGGYTAFGDEQIFLNVTDSDGKPYSGLDDASFADGLTQAAAAFGAPKPEIADTGKASARFIGNDWEKSKGGENYVSRLGGADSQLVQSLNDIAKDYAALVEKTAKNKSWY